MGELAALLQRASPVAACPGLLGRYAAAYTGPPRFWMSPSYLAYDSANQLVQHDSCLLVLRRKQLYGRPVLYLLLPPLHIGGDVAAERAALAYCNDLGIGAKLTSEDGRRYGLTQLALEKGNREYVYRGGYRPRTGRDGRHERHSLNAAGRLGMHLITSTGLSPTWAAGCSALARRWYKQTGRHRAEQRVVQAYADVGGDQLANLMLDADNRLVAYSLTERLAPGHYAIVARIRDYSYTAHPDLSLYMHQVDCASYSTTTQLTIGAPVGSKGLAAHKEKLQPDTYVQLYSLPGARELTLADVAA